MTLSRETTNALKGLAVVLILICHMFGGGFGYRIVTPLGGIGVSIFLFLSGYGLNESYISKGLRHFWKNKLLRLLLPYFLWLIILIPILYIMYGEVQWFYRYWYIEYMLIWYILFWLSKKLIPDYSEHLLLILAFSSFFVFPNIMAEQSLSFVCGVLFSVNKEKLCGYSSRYYSIVAILLLFFGITCLALKQIDALRSFGEESLIIKSCQLGIKFPIGLSLILLYTSIKSKRVIETIFSVLGVLSLEIYLVQMPLYSSISGSFTKLIIVLCMVSVLVLVLNFCTRFLIKKLTSGNV